MTPLSMIFVISLEEAQARRRLMRAQLEVPGMPAYRFIDGVDGRRLSEEQLRALYDEKAALRLVGAPLSRAEIGCASSHLLAYREIAEAAMPVALILEDDALLSYQFCDVLHRLLAEVDPAKPQALLLTHVWRYSAWGYRRIDKVHRICTPYEAYGAHAYLITLAGARAMLEAFPRVGTAADDWRCFSAAARLEVRAVVPYLVGKSPLANASQIPYRRWRTEPSNPLFGALRKYVWRKLLFQIIAKPLLRLHKQEPTW